MSPGQNGKRTAHPDFVKLPEHLLLALLTEEPNALAPLNVTADDVRKEIEKLVPPGLAASTAAELPLTPRAKRAIDHAIFEAKMVEQMRVGPEHLLVGLIQEPDGVAGRALRSLGLDVHFRSFFRCGPAAHLRADRRARGSSSPRLDDESEKCA